MRKRIVTLFTITFLLAFSFSPAVQAAGFVQDTAGVKYQNDDGTYAADAWIQVGTSIYHVDASGYVQTGWIQVGDLWYYLDVTGVCTNPEGVAAPSTLPPQAEAPQTPETQITEPDVQEYTVYITNTGEKYHRDGCRYLSKSKIPVDLSTALASGYEPCKVCKP